MSARSPFDRRAATWIYVVGIASALCAALLHLLDVTPGESGRSAGADAFSRSAIGHRAFVDLLRRLDVPVVVSKDGSARKARPGSVLVVAEPAAEAGRSGLLDELLDAPSVLLVLPKRSGAASLRHRGWLRSARLQPPGRAEAVLRHVVGDGEIVRPGGAMRWQPGPLEATPSLSSPQLVRSDRLEPLIAAREGILAGIARFGTQRILVLSDPDLVANHGIGRGGNALAAVRLVEALLGPDGVVVVDETAHGYRQSPSIWRMLLELPLLAATVQTVLAALVLLWATSARFGAPVPLEPELRPGKRALIESTATLLDYGGHGAEVVRRYLRASVRDVARALQAPRLGDDALWAWLTRLGEARGATLDVAALMRSMPSAGDGRRDRSRTLLASAVRMHQWRSRILDGRARRQ